jgi:hypothetical protein
VLPLHNSGIKSIQILKEHIVLYDAKTKNPRFLGLGFVKIFLLKKTIYTNPTDPIKPLLSLVDKRYSACHTGESMEQAVRGVCIVFIIVLLYM